MNDTLKMYGSIGSEIMNRYFVVAMCFKRQPRWRRLQTTYTETRLLAYHFDVTGPTKVFVIVLFPDKFEILVLHLPQRVPHKLCY